MCRSTTLSVRPYTNTRVGVSESGSFGYSRSASGRVGEELPARELRELLPRTLGIRDPLGDSRGESPDESALMLRPASVAVSSRVEARRKLHQPYVRDAVWTKVDCDATQDGAASRKPSVAQWGDIKTAVG